MRLKRGLATRDVLYNIGIDIFKDNPLSGIGLGNLKFVGPEYLASYPIGQWKKNDILSIGIQSSHNLFIETAAEIGLLGVFVLILIICNIGWRYFKEIRKRKGDKNLYFLIWASYIGIIARCFFESNGIINRGWITIDIFFWVMLAVFLRLDYIKLNN